MKDGFELRVALGKVKGVFATKEFKVGNTVMIGVSENFLDKNDFRASQVDENKYIRHAGLISKVNHSCNPNCGIKVNKNGVLILVAMRNIDANEEITFDYAMRIYSFDYFLMPPCECGSENCRRNITGYKDLPDQRKQDYAGFVVPYLLKLDMKRQFVRGCFKNGGFM